MEEVTRADAERYEQEWADDNFEQVDLKEYFVWRVEEMQEKARSPKSRARR